MRRKRKRATPDIALCRAFARAEWEEIPALVRPYVKRLYVGPFGKRTSAVVGINSSWDDARARLESSGIEIIAAGGWPSHWVAFVKAGGVRTRLILRTMMGVTVKRRGASA